MFDSVMWPIAASVAVVFLFACATLIPKRSGNTVDNGVADDRWFTITQWMEEDKKWCNELGETIDSMADALDALHGWAEKVEGQLEKIEGFCNLDAYNKTFVTVPANAKAKQWADGLVWFNKRPEEPGYYWYTGTYKWDGENTECPMSIIVVTRRRNMIQIDSEGFIDDNGDGGPVTFKGWWAKMDVPEFKGGDK